MTVVTNNERETIEVGREFARRLEGGEVVLLVGDLGAGKTTFVKGAAAGLGYTKNVTSPTFVIMKIYELSGHEFTRAPDARRIDAEQANNYEFTNRQKGFLKKKIKRIVHVDTYRGLEVHDLEDIGVMEYFGREDCVSFVEWGAGLEFFLKKNRFRYFVVRIKSIDENKREIEIKNLVS